MTMTSLARHVMRRSLTSVTIRAPISHHKRSSWLHHPRAPSRPATSMPMPQSVLRPSGRCTARSSKLLNTSHSGHPWRERGLRSTFPGLVQKWIDRLTEGAATDMPDPVGKTAIDTMKRAEQYLAHLQCSMDNEARDNCLDCTFCGAWFPAYWLLDITPRGTADWRNNYYRCCFQRVSGDNDDYYWFALHTSLTPPPPQPHGLKPRGPHLSGQLGRRL